MRDLKLYGFLSLFFVSLSLPLSPSTSISFIGLCFMQRRDHTLSSFQHTGADGGSANETDESTPKTVSDLFIVMLCVRTFTLCARIIPPIEIP